MKIDTSTIKNYEKLSAEEKVAVLEGYDLETDYTGYVKKDVFDTTAKEAADYKKKWKATLSEKEQLEIDEAEKRKTMETELAELKNEKALSDHKSKLVAIGYDEKLAAETAKALVDGDMDKVFENQKKFALDKEKAIKKDLLKNTPEPPSGGGSDKITKDQFDKMSYRQRTELYNTDKDLYKELTGAGGTE